MNLTITRITARALLGRKRALLLLPMPALLIGLTLLANGTGVPAADWGPIVLGEMGITVILPLTALIVGSSVLGLEIEDGTITHILAKPLPRREIVLSKLFVAWGVTTLAAAAPLAVAGAIAGGPGLALGLLGGATLGALAYSAVFLAFSLLSRRPVAIGLIYIMLWENLLVRFASGAKVLSVQRYTTATADTISPSELLNATLPGVVAAALAVAVIAAGTMLATMRLRSFALTGETS
ncbi:MAG: ABC transporter permease subunit [Pseudonocardiaceae bacterium]|nr:ABC transporter permease subunit [Pseudonocardiaceae bacterium]